MERRVVLLVEDEVRLNEINRRALEGEGFEVLTALTLAAARKHLAQCKPDVILLDVLLPDGNGIKFCGKIRGDTDAHILFLTSRAEHEDKIRGLETGGDDYIAKPYRLEEMLSRVRAVMRRREMEAVKQSDRFFVRGPLILDTIASRAFVDGVDLLLQPKEFALLRLFTRKENEVISAETIYEAIWKLPMGGDKNSVQATVSRLRKKIDAYGYDVVLTRGKGYCFKKKIV